MQPLTEGQVRQALAVAGVTPVEDPAAIARGISGALALGAPAFAAIPFAAEPLSFLVALALARAEP